MEIRATCLNPDLSVLPGSGTVHRVGFGPFSAKRARGMSRWNFQPRQTENRKNSKNTRRFAIWNYWSGIRCPNVRSWQIATCIRGLQVSDHSNRFRVDADARAVPAFRMERRMFELRAVFLTRTGNALKNNMIPLRIWRCRMTATRNLIMLGAAWDDLSGCLLP